MEHATALLERISSRSDLLKPLLVLEAPLAPIHPIRHMLEHLTSTPVHPVYFPFVRFGFLHATRAAIGWAAMTKARTERPGVLQDMLGYLTLSWGGATLVSLLLSTPPAWLISPMPWGVYVTAYVLLVQSGAARALASAPALPISLALSLADGMLRGAAISSMPATASVAASSSWMTPVILGVIATCGGPWIAQTLGMQKNQWVAGAPAVLNGGVLNTLEVWGAAAAGILYAALTQANPAFEPFQRLVSTSIPAEYLQVTADTHSHGGQVTSDFARALIVLLLTELFAARAITEAAISWRARPAPTITAVKHEVRALLTPATVPRKETSDSATTSALKSPVDPSEGGTSPKQRKRKARRGKSKSTTPAP